MLHHDIEDTSFTVIRGISEAGNTGFNGQPGMDDVDSIWLHWSEVTFAVSFLSDLNSQPLTCDNNTVS